MRAAPPFLDTQPAKPRLFDPVHLHRSSNPLFIRSSNHSGLARSHDMLGSRHASPITSCHSGTLAELDFGSACRSRRNKKEHPRSSVPFSASAAQSFCLSDAMRHCSEFLGHIPETMLRFAIRPRLLSLRQRHLRPRHSDVRHLAEQMADDVEVRSLLVVGPCDIPR